VLEQIDRFKDLRVLVVGEAIIDEYHYCTPDAMSNKTPTLSVRFDSEETFAGGVVPVGNHVAGLCRGVTILAGVGDGDRDAAFLQSQLAGGVEIDFVVRDDGPTVRKRRFVHRFLNQKLFELTFLNDRPINNETQTAFLSVVDRLAPQADIVIVLDFGHGYITQPIVQRLRLRSKFLAVNAQINSSNRGFNTIRKYQGADFISVDEHELRLPYGDRYGPLEQLILALSDETGCRNINVTLGNRGTHYFDGKQFFRAPILTNQVVDTIGAGDASLAATALAVRAGSPAELVPFLGNCMGGLMAQIVGHRQPVSTGDLRRFITALLA